MSEIEFNNIFKRINTKDTLKGSKKTLSRGLFFFFYDFVGCLMMNSNRLKLYFYLIFIIFVFFSFIIVPKEQSRVNSKKPIIVDYVLFSNDKTKEVKTIPYYENKNISFDEWLAKHKISAELVPESFTFDKYLESQNEIKYKQKIIYKPYYKTRYDLIARNIILFGCVLVGIFLSIRLRQTRQ